MKKFAAMTLTLLISVGVFAQTKPTSVGSCNTPAIVIKPTPAAQALNDAVDDQVTQQKAFSESLDKAKASLTAAQKQNTDEVNALQKQLNDRVRADKNYAPLLAQIDAIQKKIADAQQKAQNDFSRLAGPLQNSVASDQALMTGLESVVRKENDLPETAVFDTTTKTWSIPPAKPASKKEDKAIPSTPASTQ